MRARQEAAARFEDFAFGAHNPTRYAGLENEIANCYANSLLQARSGSPFPCLPEHLSCMIEGGPCQGTTALVSAPSGHRGEGCTKTAESQVEEPSVTRPVNSTANPPSYELEALLTVPSCTTRAHRDTVPR